MVLGALVLLGVLGELVPTHEGLGAVLALELAVSLGAVGIQL